MIKIVKSLVFAALFSVLIFAKPAHAQTINATSCGAADVQSAINKATAGGTINIPAGSCSWAGSTVTLSKAITMNGAGQTLTHIDLGTVANVFVITKQVGGVTRIQNINFTMTNSKPDPKGVVVNGPWPSGQSVIFYNVTLTMNNADFITIHSPGGVIFSHLTFNAKQWSDTLLQSKDSSTTGLLSWSTADSMGTRDTTGYMNTYLEDSIFNGGTMTDCDDACRIVVRHNTGHDSTGFNSHGDDSSPLGMRHFEIYNNSFLFDVACNGASNTDISNMNQWIWLRGGTGVIYSNKFDRLQSQCWGTKPIVRLSIRGAEDDRPQGTCANTHYPATHQLGQSNNGVADFTDPIYFWNNTQNQGADNNGFSISANGGWNWGNPCGFVWGTFWQWDRDGIDGTLATSSSDTGSTQEIYQPASTAKPGYTAYAYPHPLVNSSGSTSGPTAPSNLLATVN